MAYLFKHQMTWTWDFQQVYLSAFQKENNATYSTY